MVNKFSDLEYYEKSSLNFNITIKVDGVAQDISGDTVKLYIKRSKKESDSDAQLIKNADVTTNGTNGEAQFRLTPSDNDIIPGEYYYEIIWIKSTGDEYVLESGITEIRDRVAD